MGKEAVERGLYHCSSSDRPEKKCQYLPFHHSCSLRPHRRWDGTGFVHERWPYKEEVAPPNVSKSPGSPRSSLGLGRSPHSLSWWVGSSPRPGMELPACSSPTADDRSLISNLSDRLHHNPFLLDLPNRGAAWHHVKQAGENLGKAPEGPCGERAAQSLGLTFSLAPPPPVPRAQVVLPGL